MRYGQTNIGTRPTPRVFSLHQLPVGQAAETSSWTVSSTATGRVRKRFCLKSMQPPSDLYKTMIVDASTNKNVTIAVMGATGSGKTSFINLASGSNLLIGRGLNSCTDVVQVSQPFELDGRTLTLIDTPGFDDTTKSDTDVLRIISEHLASEYKNAKKLAGVIYIHRISDFRMGGISTRNFRIFRQLCGDTSLKNVVIVTNMWGEVEKAIGEARESELAGKVKFFKPALDKGALMLRHENTRNSAHNILRQIIQNHPVTLQIQREMVDEKRDISQTVAADELNSEIMLQRRRYRNEMRALKEETEEAVRIKDQQRKREVESKTLALLDEIRAVWAEAEGRASAYCEDNQRLEREMQVLVETACREGERAREENRRQTEELERKLQEARGP